MSRRGTRRKIKMVVYCGGWSRRGGEQREQAMKKNEHSIW
jgi:hypothetical protein